MRADDTSLASTPLHTSPMNEPGRRYTIPLNDRRTSTPRHQMPAVPNPKRESLLQTSISALSKLANASNTTNDGSTSLQVVDDELLHLDLEEALYPGGKPDAFSPAAYKNLQMNAMGLLLKLHNAYRSRTAALKVAEAERDTQKDDLIATRTRAIQLKQQVENMQRQAVEHERSMMELMNELAAEKRARISEGDEQEKTLVVSCIPEATGEGSISEDLGVDEAQQMRKWRKSAVTIRSDMSYDSDGDSVEGESIFSRSRSPTLLSVVPSIAPSETTSPAQSRPPNLGLPRSRTPLPMSTFSKVWKGITKVEEDGCRCKGQDASVAWDTVNLLKSENKALKERVGELEDVVEGALDIVNGVGI